MRNDAAIVVTTTSPFPQYFLDELEKRGRVQKLADFKAVNDMAGYEKALAGCEIAVASGGSSFKEKDYAIAKKLKLIADFGVGYDGIDIPCANAHRVLVSHTPNVLNDDVADLAVAIGTTSHSLSYLFNQYLEKNYYDYINEYRVEEFKSLILKDEYAKYTLTAMAEYCGFSSRASFFRTFKKLAGITPNEYIKQVSGEHRPVDWEAF